MGRSGGPQEMGRGPVHGQKEENNHLVKVGRRCDGSGVGLWPVEDQKRKMESGWMFLLQCREEHSGLEKPWQFVKSCVFLGLLIYDPVRIASRF